MLRGEYSPNNESLSLLISSQWKHINEDTKTASVNSYKSCKDVVTCFSLQFYQFGTYSVQKGIHVWEGTQRVFDSVHIDRKA